jgi:UDP-glucuronate decarboxylase
MVTPDTMTGPINLGNPAEFTIQELAEKIVELTDSKSKITYLPPVSDDPVQRKPNIDLAYKELNSWQPKTKLEEGLKNTITYFEKLINSSQLSDWKYSH